MLRLTPPDRIGEFYGLYGMVGRFSAIIGPLLWAGSVRIVQGMGYGVLQAQGVGLLVLLALMFISRAILRSVDDSPRDWSKLRGSAA
jgi:UMF1 family MFS transporter